MKHGTGTPESIDHNGDILPAVPLASAARITDGVRLIAGAIARWHADGEAPLQVVSILNGAKKFAADLTHELAKAGIASDLHEIKISSTLGARATGRASLEQGSLPAKQFRGKRALIVDDIIDTGATAVFAKELVGALGAAEVRLAVAVNKWKRLSHMADFAVLDLMLEPERMPVINGRRADYWLFGYGMDLDGRFRECAGIAYVEVAPGAD